MRKGAGAGARDFSASPSKCGPSFSSVCRQGGRGRAPTNKKGIGGRASHSFMDLLLVRRQFSCSHRRNFLATVGGGKGGRSGEGNIKSEQDHLGGTPDEILKNQGITVRTYLFLDYQNSWRKEEERERRTGEGEKGSDF